MDIIASMHSGLIGVVVAGTLIWFFQSIYTIRTNKAKMYITRVEKCEDEFYEKVKKSKLGIVFLFRIIVNGYEITPAVQETANTVILTLQELIDYTYDNYCLETYSKHVKCIFDNYNNFSSTYNTYNEAKRELSAGDAQNYIDNLAKYKNKILESYKEIDSVYQ